jgi:hypothetical protein
MVYKSDMHLKLLQSVLSLFLSTVSKIESLHFSGSWGISDFNKSYRPRTNIVKDEKDDFAAGLHAILYRWRKHFSQLLVLHGVHDVGQTETHQSHWCLS